MITRDSPFSDIKINDKFPAHRVVLADASETFKNMIGDLGEDVHELTLEYPDELVDQLLDYIYYKKCNITCDLYGLIMYMNIHDFKFSDAMIGTISTDELRAILIKFDVEYEFHIEKPSLADYRVLCCLPHEQFMNAINSVMVDRLDYRKKKDENEFQIFFVAVSLRCLIPWYENFHITYAVYQRMMAREKITGISTSLLHNRSMAKYDLLATVDNIPISVITLTKQCMEVLKSLGIEVPE